MGLNDTDSDPPNLVQATVLSPETCRWTWPALTATIVPANADAERNALLAQSRPDQCTPLLGPRK